MLSSPSGHELKEHLKLAEMRNTVIWARPGGVGQDSEHRFVI